jgi:TonB family protein
VRAFIDRALSHYFRIKQIKKYSLRTHTPSITSLSFSNLEEERRSMNRIRIGHRHHSLGWLAFQFFQGAALALILTVAMPASAADERAVKSRVAPVYPEMARRMRIAGAVKLEANVDAQGKVTEVKAVSGNHMLAVAAEDAVRKWKFVPGSGDSSVTVEVDFAASQ